jgi:restriction system protein
MARSIYSSMMAVQRAAAAEQRRSEREQRAANRDQKKQYLADRAGEVAEMNGELAEKVGELQNLLSAGMSSFKMPRFSMLKKKHESVPFRPGDLGKPIVPPAEQDFLPRPLGGFGRLFKLAREKNELAITQGRNKFRAACDTHSKVEKQRLEKLDAAQKAFESGVQAHRKEVEEYNNQVDAFEAGVNSGDAKALIDYFTMVLEQSDYPEGFPMEWKVAYIGESKQLVVEMELPTLDIVPTTASYRFVKTSDEMREAPRSAAQIRSIYASIVSGMTLRVLWEVFSADKHKHVDTVVLNGYVDTIDKATGRPARPCLVTVRTTRDVFMAMDLSRVEPEACLRALNASVSKSPAELVPVRPVLEFKMVDPRFIEEADVISTLDQRPNLMELTPSEFESLITNLFTKMGLETRQTVASRDGGVDCVAFDPRPIFGGKVVIQAKRYKNTVGVSAVRDLFGTMQNEGASKGILVTTSGYGKASFEFAEGKPLELLSGSNLLHLLAEHAGIEAKIVPPEDWMDPKPDRT